MFLSRRTPRKKKQSEEKPRVRRSKKNTQTQSEHGQPPPSLPSWRQRQRCRVRAHAHTQGEGGHGHAFSLGVARVHVSTPAATFPPPSAVTAHHPDPALGTLPAVCRSCSGSRGFCRRPQAESEEEGAR